MKILFADKFPEHFLNQLQDRGHVCEYQPDLTAGELPASVGGFDILVVRSTRVDAAVIDAADA
jgi:D-3-phosphoglycerate dehydrogenase / 2-oxoglutarate reductase